MCKDRVVHPSAVGESRVFTSSLLSLVVLILPGILVWTWPLVLPTDSLVCTPAPCQRLPGPLAQSIAPALCFLCAGHPLLGPAFDFEFYVLTQLPPLDGLPKSRVWVLGGVVSSCSGAWTHVTRQGPHRQQPLMGCVSSVHSRWTSTAGCAGRTVTVRSSGRATSPQRSTRRRFSTLKMTSTAGSTAFQQDILVFAIGTWVSSVSHMKTADLVSRQSIWVIKSSNPGC